MSFIANTAFEPIVTNAIYDSTINVTGQFGTVAGSVFTGADCSAGLLCTQFALMPNAGYAAGNYNGNSWQFQAATDGAGGKYGAGGVWAFNSYDVNKVSQTNSPQTNTWRVGARTLGLGLPAGVDGDFTEIVPEKIYGFGAGNFSTLPTAADTQIYYTIANGLLVASASAPAAGSGLYFKYLYTKNFTQGTTNAGTEYVCRALVA